MKILIWGASNSGADLARSVKDGVEVVAFIDNDVRKIGTNFWGFPVIAKEDIAKTGFDRIILSTAFDNQNLVMWIVENLGVSENRLFDVTGGVFEDRRIWAVNQLAGLIYENKVGGTAAELGVCKGDFAKKISGAFPDRKLHLFDTFEGFSDLEISAEKSLNLNSATSYTFQYIPIDMIKEKMPHPENCCFHVGYFPDTAAGLEDEKFCFVSIDTDLFQPVYSGLKFFYERLSKGGFIMVHDYYNKEFPGAKLAADRFAAEENAVFVPIQDHGGSVVFGKR